MHLVMQPGDRFGRLILLERIPGKHGGVNVRWKCQCDCGEIRFVEREKLKRGLTRSCGCLQRETCRLTHTKHGYRYLGSWRRWNDMIRRCNNPEATGFENYGGRGIEVCAEWLSFEKFRDDMGEPPEGMSLGRVDNAIGYCKTNCRWETRKQQNRNRRNVRLFTFGNETKPVAEWIELFGLKYDTVTSRIKRGWSTEKSLFYDHQSK